MAVERIEVLAIRGFKVVEDTANGKKATIIEPGKTVNVNVGLARMLIQTGKASLVKVKKIQKEKE